MRQDPRFQFRALAAAAMLAIAVPATAQLSSATVRGAITAEAKAQPGATITAMNTTTGQVTRTTSRADGSYTLVGLAPGSYKINITAPGLAPRTETLVVLVGQTVDLDMSLAKIGTAQLDTVVVSGAAVQDRKTSEVGTNVTTKQIEALPQNSRNFLAFADLAPGARVDTDPKTGQVTFRGGAQDRDNTNIFLDGVGQKNYILRGGASGLDATRGNPFPQTAIAEYKVLSSNYKAEFEQVSSTALTAVTKSGTNELHGEVFGDRTSTNWRAYSPFESEAKNKGVDRQPTTAYQYGFNLGGAIKPDVAHFFIAYEGKDINDSRSVIAQRTELLPNAGIVPGLLAQQGSTINKFKEDLVFGKVDLALSDEQKLILTARVRREKDLVPESSTVSVPGNDKNRANDETRFDLKHEWSTGDFFNEARIGYESYRFNPHSNSTSPFFKYKISEQNTLLGSSDVLFVGGSPDAQNKQQKAWNLQEDLTYTGLKSHTMKGGFKIKEVTSHLAGTPRSVDTIEAVIDKTTGLPYYDAATQNCTTIAGSGSAAPSSSVNDTPQCHILRAEASDSVSFKNKQLGLYFQDDWAVTKQLELNLGVRWDYETNMLNDNYVTPADRVAALFSLEPVQANGTSAGRGASPAGLPVSPGQTYDQSLAKGGINIRDFISTGNNRKAFTGAIQPRLGFSFDVNGDKNTVVFGGVGRAYDRTIADQVFNEVSKNRVANGEIWLIRNNHKMPFTDQFSLGLRQGMGAWNGEVGAIYQRGHNQFNWYGGNRDPQGGYGKQSPIDPLWGGPAGYGTLILGDFITQTKTMSVYFKAEKPYTKSSGWGAAATYTYSDAKTTNINWTDDMFNWTYGRSTSGFNPSTDVERHRLVATGVADGILPWGLLLSGKMTLGSGLPYRITDCTRGDGTCVYVKGESATFRQFDLGLAKDVRFGIGQFTVRLDVINVFNTVNYKGWDAWAGAKGTANYLGGDNAHLGVPNDISSPMRTVKLSMRYAF
ncbi:TonB-dependent receptor [soil metagenome]